MQVIAVDIGNSSMRIALGNSHNQAWQLVAVIRDNQPLNPKLDSFASLPEAAFWAVSSVHQARQDQLSQWVSTHRPKDQFHLISPEDVALESNVESRTQLGRDRLIAAWMAVQLNHQLGPLVVVDAGTAVTIDWVDDRSVFQGGFIFPGADLNCQQLSKNTAALPFLSRERRVQLLGLNPSSPPTVPPPNTDLRLGKSTTTAILQGIYQSQVEGISGIVDRLVSGHAHPVSVYATGGGIAEIIEFSQSLQVTIPRSWNHCPDLVLRGANAIGHALLQKLCH